MLLLTVYLRMTTGSNLHAIHAMEHPRWEDYDYERIDNAPNRLYWLGDGQTVNETNNTGDRKSTRSLHVTHQSTNLGDFQLSGI